MRTTFEQQNSRECEVVQRLLLAYTDGALSARQMWEVERHLADCKTCSTQAQQMQLLVNALRNVERRDTSDLFMAKLHERLDTLPAPTSRSYMARLREDFAALSDIVRPRRLSLVGACMAAVAIIVVLILSRPASVSIPSSAVQAMAAPHLQQALERHVATAAADPLDDPAAERLAANPSLDTDASGTE